MNSVNDFNYVHTASSSPTGGEGLLLSVILQAAVDVSDDDLETRAGARAYFAGPVYQHHLSWLELDPTMLPDFLEGSHPRPCPDCLEKPGRLAYLRQLLTSDEPDWPQRRAELSVMAWLERLAELRVLEKRER